MSATHVVDAGKDPPDIPSGTQISPDLSPSDAEDLFERRKRKADDNNQNVPKKIGGQNNPAASVQDTYVHPQSESKNYTEDDQGPYVIHISKKESDPSVNVSLRAIKIGQLLYRNNVQNIVKGSVKDIGRNRVEIAFKSHEDANMFLELPLVKEGRFEASIPTYNVTRMGIVRGIPVDVGMQELAESVELPDRCGDIIKARRLNRKQRTEGSVSWVPTQTVVLTFAGQKLPPHIYLYNMSIPVEQYMLPTIQCLNCCRFGHIKAQCRSKARCHKCSQPHSGETCQVDTPTCLLCLGCHEATDKSCPEHSRQRSIKIVMSQENVSYVVASARFPTVRKSYTDVVKSSSQPPVPAVSLTQSASQHPPAASRTSYRKTVFIPRSPRPHIPNGYDRQSHQDIVNPPPSELSNGCALPVQSTASPNENLLESLISVLINIISKFNDSLPSNVIEKLAPLINIVENGSKNSPMELPEHC